MFGDGGHAEPVDVAQHQRRPIGRVESRQHQRRQPGSIDPGAVTVSLASGTATDGYGRKWSFLASVENYNRVRAMHQKNLIVPLVGDFGGPKALRMTGQYVRDHGAIVNVFYLSNVEDYIQPVFAGYARNIASLPIDQTSLFIRTSLQTNSFRPWLSPISSFARPRDIR